MVKHKKKKFQYLDVFEKQKTQELEDANILASQRMVSLIEEQQLAIEKNEKLLSLKRFLDRLDESHDQMVIDLIIYPAFEDIYLTLSVATSGESPIDTISMTPISHISLFSFMSLLISKRLSGDGNDFRGLILMLIGEQQVTIKELQQLVIAHYDQNTMIIGVVNDYSYDMFLKIDLVFVVDTISDLSYEDGICSGPALNCYYDMKGWKMFSWDKFPGETWMIHKSNIDTTLKRSPDGLYHVSSQDDFFTSEEVET